MTVAVTLHNHPEIEQARAQAPAEVRAEIVSGALLMAPAPRTRHQVASANLYLVLQQEITRRRRQGPPSQPGAWRLIPVPELHLGVGPDKLNPDLAGWRTERAPSLDDYPIVIAPDWVCEVLSPSTEAHDRAVKLPAFASHGTTHAWLIDPELKRLEVYRVT
ncbi:MAG: Uma2 family endonuclease, partial [Deltaproteobacteria bacterium]|nr:Uma2 family endonuclease [Deltaproteobacteria bacterium]